MSLSRLEAGFIPLIDSAPLIVARELGFAEAEGLRLELTRAPSWSTLRDMLALGRIEAAHMLAPVPVATALGLGGLSTALDVLSVLSVNGNVVAVSRPLADRMRQAGHVFDFWDARSAGEALIAASTSRLRIGVPFPFSMHAELVYYWLGALSPSAVTELDIRTVPPPLMAEALAAGEIDAFCVGEPWGSVAVEAGVAELLLPGAAIWRFAPEKVLAVRHEWTESEPELTGRLMRAVWAAGRWLGDERNRTTAVEILASRDHLDIQPELIERAFAGRLVISPRGEERVVPRFIEFFDAAATFPWRSQAAWIAARLAKRMALDPATVTIAKRVFRSDLYRRHLRGTGAEMPGASEKVEGALSARAPASSDSGRLYLGPDTFFDSRTFDPEAPD